MPAVSQSTDLDDVIRGERVTLRAARDDDVDRIVAMRSTPEVLARWGGTDHRAEFAADLADPELHLYVVRDERGDVIGAIQWHEESDPMYRHAGIDLYLDPAVHRRGYGTDAVRALAVHLVRVLGHHRLEIDPAADNAAAVACYRRVGFRPVGVMRRYERGPDGTWRDGLLMDLLAEDLG